MTKNVLSEWRKEFVWQSSQLNPSKRYIREDILKVERVLLDFFGEEFFVAEINKVENVIGSNWILDLLSQYRKSAVISLFEVCSLLDFLQKQDTSIQKKMKSTIRSIKEFQNLFFELYIYRVLEWNKIKIDKKVIKNGQELEGLCWIKDKEFIFECKKINSINAEENEAFVQVMAELMLSFNKIKVGKECVGYIHLKKEFKKAKNEAIKALKDFARNPQNFFKDKIDFLFESDLTKIQIEAYNEIRYMEYFTESLDPSFIFKIQPPLALVPNAENNFKLIGEYNYSNREDKIVEKFMDTIKKKRKQHAKSRNDYRIFFFDNEWQNTLKMPLIPMGGVKNDEKIANYVNAKETNDIICIVNRNYIIYPPQTKIKVYCKKEFDDIKKVLENLRTSFDFSIR